MSILSLKSIRVGLGQVSLLTLQRTFPRDQNRRQTQVKCQQVWNVLRLLSFLNMLPLSQLYSQYQLLWTAEVGYCHQLSLLVFLRCSVNSKENFYCLSVCLSVHIVPCFSLSSTATFIVRNPKQINGRTWKNRQLEDHSDFKPLDVICASAPCLRNGAGLYTVHACRFSSSLTQVTRT